MEKSIDSCIGKDSTYNICYACNQVINDRYLMKAIDKFWHEDCLKCVCCDARLGEIGCKLYTKANLILCKKDYLRLFGSTGQCSVCKKVIQAYELVMKVNGLVFHLECFRCNICEKE